MEVSYTLAEKLTLLIENLTGNELTLTDTNRNDVVTYCLTALDVLWELHRFIDVSNEKNSGKTRITKIFATIIKNLEACLGGAN